MKTNKALSILEKQNYVRITNKLKDAVSEAVDSVVDKMKELDIRELYIPDVGTLIISERYANGGQFHYELFQWEVKQPVNLYDEEDINGDLQSTHKMRADGESSGQYYAGDFNHWYSYPSRSAVMKFSLNFNKIIQSLSNTEKEQVQESEKAIELIENGIK